MRGDDFSVACFAMSIPILICCICVLSPILAGVDLGLCISSKSKCTANIYYPVINGREEIDCGIYTISLFSSNNYITSFARVILLAVHIAVYSLLALIGCVALLLAGIICLMIIALVFLIMLLFWIILIVVLLSPFIIGIFGIVLAYRFMIN